MGSSAGLKALSQNESVHTHLVSVGWLVDVGVDLCFSSHMHGTLTEGLVPEIDEQWKKVFQIYHLSLGMMLVFKIWLNFNTRSLHILVCELFSDAMKPFQQSVLLRLMQTKEMINKVLSP
jgi:hypothetical protein